MNTLTISDAFCTKCGLAAQGQDSDGRCLHCRHEANRDTDDGIQVGPLFIAIGSVGFIIAALVAWGIL